MPDIPAEAVQAAANAALAARIVREASAAGVASPVSCPSAAPESTQSPETTSAAPVYRSGVERPAESLSALRDQIARAIALRAGSQAFDHTDRAWDDLRNRWLTYADAVLAVRDDELARALRIADYHADQHRQAADATARVHQVCRQALATPDAPDRWAVAAQVRAALEGPEPQVGAGAVPEHTAPATTEETAP